MELNTQDRLIILDLMPDHGNAATCRVIRDAQMLLGFSDEESAALELRSGEGNRLHWNPAADVPREFALGVVASRIIRERLAELEAKGLLTVRQLSLYERFCEEPKATAEQEN